MRGKERSTPPAERAGTPLEELHGQTVEALFCDDEP